MIQLDVPSIVAEACRRCEALVTEGDLRQAEQVARQILRVDPASVPGKYGLALSLGLNGRFDEAVGILLTCPRDHRTHNNLGLLYARANDSARAMAHFELACVAGESTPRVNLALECAKVRDFLAAERHFLDVSIGQCPHAWFNYGAYLYSRKKFFAAKKAYQKALTIKEDLAVARHNLGATQMMLGEPAGWQTLESRFQAFPRLAAIRDSFKVPYWDGGGGKVVFFNEQGLGDFVQFSRFLAGLPCEKYVAVEPPLRTLAQAMGLTVWDGQKVDACYSIMSLPLRGGVPAGLPFRLPDKSPGWGRYASSFKIGLCWAGSPLHPNDVNRSIHLRQLAPMTRTPGTKWFALSKSYGKRRDRSGRVVDFEELAEGTQIVALDFKDVLELAGMIDCMDAVVTVDTLVAHLSGTLGKPTYLMLPWLPDWRWRASGSSTPWYPSVQIFRQSREGDWSDVMLRVHGELIRKARVSAGGWTP